MLTDPALNAADSESVEVWAPLHAWRALGQLRAEEAIAPLVEMLAAVDATEDDWADGEIPVVLGLIGPAAMPAIVGLLADAHKGRRPRAAAASALAEIGKHHPETRVACIETLAAQLALARRQHPFLNGCIIAELLDLHAVEAAPAIEKAFADKRVDLSAVGDWEEAQIDLGLLEKRRTPPRNWILEAMPPSSPAAPLFVPSRRHQPSATQKSRAKRKQAERSRKQNRKR